jgi:hypothetical protein
MNISNVIIWGHKLHTHTHSYIHGSFYKAFTYLGYNTLWLDDNDNISQINFSNSLFLTEGQVDKNIPLLPNCYYILHNVEQDKYSCIPESNKLIIQVYTHDCLSRDPIKIDELIYFSQNCLYFPWATDLLPNEINDNINRVKEGKITTKNEINIVGSNYFTVLNEVQSFCKSKNINYNLISGPYNHVDYKINERVIQESILAPAVQVKDQVDYGYIPCRIFKNISYGKMGLTNNHMVYLLFNGNIIYDRNIDALLTRGLEFEKKDSEYKNSILIPLMEFVRDKHTYLNRIQIMLYIFNEKVKGEL